MQTNIELKTYQNSWESDYAYWIYELSQLLELDATDQFEHMGSTAIPGILAKPTIDIMLGVDRIENFSVKNMKALEEDGFDYVSILEEENPYRKYFQLLDEEGNHLVHLHVVTRGGHFWHRHLLFRNYLLKHPQAVQAYSDIKKQALAQAQTRDDYNAYKTAFVFDCLRKAFMNRELNPPLQIKDDQYALQPQAYMADLVNQFYVSPEQCVEDIAIWDREGKGLFWWLSY